MAKWSTDCCRPQRTRGSGAILGVALLLVLGAALTWAPAVEAQTSCGALITLAPDKGQMPPGDVLTPSGASSVVNIVVNVFQSCLTNGLPATAVITGTTLADVACATANNLGQPGGCLAGEQLNTLHVTSCLGEPGVTCVAQNDGNANPTLAALTFTDSCMPVLGSG